MPRWAVRRVSHPIGRASGRPLHSLDGLFLHLHTYRPPPWSGQLLALVAPPEQKEANEKETCHSEQPQTSEPSTSEHKSYLQVGASSCQESPAHWCYRACVYVCRHPTSYATRWDEPGTQSERGQHVPPRGKITALYEEYLSVPFRVQTRNVLLVALCNHVRS